MQIQQYKEPVVTITIGTTQDNLKRPGTCPYPQIGKKTCTTLTASSQAVQLPSALVVYLAHHQDCAIPLHQGAYCLGQHCHSSQLPEISVYYLTGLQHAAPNAPCIGQ